jgi:K+-transporting ATPase ATPase C chain
MPRPLLVLTALFLLLCCGLYPLGVAGLGHVFFRAAAEGSVLEKDGAPRASTLIGQDFRDPRYFHGRPSATPDFPTNAGNSAAANAAVASAAYRKTLEDRLAALKALDPENPLPVPADLVAASGSGLDPEISPEAALYQIARVARVRNMEATDVKKLVDRATKGRTLGFLGAPRVNLIELNLALDGKL